MPLLSLDVGFKNLGWALWEKGQLQDMGCIVTDKSARKTTRTADDYAFRAAQIARNLNGLIKDYSVQAIVAELPSGGAQSAKAMVMMGMATAVVSSVASVLNLPAEWCTPNEVKLAVSGKRSATKDEIMDLVAEKMGFEKTNGGRVIKYNGIQKGLFEHIADAIGAYWALSDANLVKIFG